MAKTYVSKSINQTKEIAKEIFDNLVDGDIIALYGDLGSGKTTLSQYIGGFLGASGVISSPTFLILKEYSLPKSEFLSFYHLDLYRLRNRKELEDIGLVDIISQKKGITIIEWPELADGILPERTKKINLSFVDESTRKIEVLND